jgi:hypothetical protein
MLGYSKLNGQYNLCPLFAILFELDAYAFFKGHVPKGEFLDVFEQRTVRLFDASLSKKK